MVISDGFIGNFHLKNPSGHKMSLGSNKLLTDMSTRNIVWRKWRVVLRADKLTTFTCGLSADIRALPSGTLKAFPGLYNNCFNFTVVINALR